MKLKLLPVLVFSLGFGLACAGGGTTTETPPPPPPPADGSIGVVECDDYIKKVEACLGNLPAEAKSSVEGSLKANRDAWAQAAATPQGKSALSTGCKMALDSFTCPDMGSMGAADPSDAGPGKEGIDEHEGAPGQMVGGPTSAGAANPAVKETDTKASSTSGTKNSTLTVKPGSGTHDPKPRSSASGERSRSGGTTTNPRSTGGTTSGGSKGGASKERHR